MAEASIDKLVIDISSDAAAAVSGFEALETQLKSLGATIGSVSPQLKSFANSVKALKSATAGLNLSGLTAVKDVKITAKKADNLNALVTAVNGIDTSKVAGVTKLGTALASFSDFKLSASSVTQLERVPNVLQELVKINLTAFSRELSSLAKALSPLATNVERLASAYTKLPKSLRTSAAAARTVVSTNKTLAASSTQAAKAAQEQSSAQLGLGGILSSSIGKITAFGAAWSGFKSVFQATIGNVNSYIENMNLFAASMGSATQAATEFGMEVQNALGIDFGEWARNQGVFQTLITGMGETADRANVMSQQLTQLGYDIASFYNISVEEAMLKLQSGMAGELEPLRRLGWDLSNARMQIEATKLGIEGNVSTMTQAEKVGLRYYLIMNQVTQTHGDMARTIASPANQLRVLQAQVTLTARAIGNLLIPALNAILPVVMAVVKAIRILAESIAKFFGIDATFEVDYSTLDTSGIASGVDDLTDSIDDSGKAADKAKKKVKEYQNTVMGFDELNKLNPKNEDTSSDGSGSGNGGAGGAGGLDLPLDTYDFLAGLTDTIGEFTDDLAQKLVELLPLISAIGAGLAAWKIGNSLGLGLGQCIGLLIGVAGAVYYAWNLIDAWNNGVNFDNLLGMIGGLGLAVAGFTLAFGPVAGIITAIIGLAGMGIVSIRDMFLNGQNWANVFGGAISELGLGALAGFLQWVDDIIRAFCGAHAPASKFVEFLKPIGKFAGVLGKIAGVIGVVISVVDIFISIGEIIDAVSSGAEIANETIFSLVTAILGIGLALTAVFGWPALVVAAIVAAVAAIAALIYNNWDAICEFFAGLPEWFSTNVIQPICEFFGGIGEFFAGLWEGIVNGISEWWSGVGAWFDTNVVQPVMNFFSPLIDWFSELWGSIFATVEAIWTNIGVFIGGIWQIVCRVWEVAGQWFNDNVLQPVAGFFSSVWETISNTVSNVWDTICNTLGAGVDWINSNIITPIRDFFAGVWEGVSKAASDAWNGIQQVFSNVASFFGEVFSSAWQRVCEVFSIGGALFDNIRNGIVDAFKMVANGIIGGINTVVSIPFNNINNILGIMRGIDILGVKPFSGFVDIPVPQIPQFAEGRYGINAGQLFIARESGAEMVGSMGNHTTVANNQQIVEGIESGVYNAVVKALVSTSSNDGNKTIEIPLIIGEKEIARATYTGLNSMVRTGEIKAAFV